jgi:hypothetical protein
LGIVALHDESRVNPVPSLRFSKFADGVPSVLAHLGTQNPYVVSDFAPDDLENIARPDFDAPTREDRESAPFISMNDGSIVENVAELHTVLEKRRHHAARVPPA